MKNKTRSLEKQLLSLEAERDLCYNEFIKDVNNTDYTQKFSELSDKIDQLRNIISTFKQK